MQRAIDQISDPALPIELRSVSVNEAGGLARRERQLPLAFEFSWRDTEFQGVVRESDGAVLLELSIGIGRLPFTAEDASGRNRLLAVITNETDSRPGSLKVVRDSTVMLSKEVALPSSEALTANGLVTNIAVAVLTLAPYLDLLTEYRAN